MLILLFDKAVDNNSISDNQSLSADHRVFSMKELQIFLHGDIQQAANILATLSVVGVNYSDLMGVLDKQMGFFCTPKGIPDRPKWNFFYECGAIASEMVSDPVMNFLMSDGTLKPFLLGFL